MTKQTPPKLKEILSEFRRFTYSDENEDVFLLEGYDRKRNINNDDIPWLEAFIKKVWKVAHENGYQKGIKDQVGAEAKYNRALFEQIKREL